MYDVITIGSATRDAFVEVPFAKFLHDKRFIAGKGLCFSLGSKLAVPNIEFRTGGGATNAAVSLALQGLKVATICRVGNDLSGKIVIHELKNFHIDTKFIEIDKNLATAYSIILVSKNKGERTILVFRGAAQKIKGELINFKKLKTKWFYIASVSGNFNLLRKIFDYASENKAKILYNPGSLELKKGLKKLKPFFRKCDIVILNQEEASYLTRVDYRKENKIFKKMDKVVKGIFVMTKGTRGVIVSDGKYIYKAGILKSKVVDRTGAGDAFGSGFLAGYLRKKDICYAIQFATANATSVVQSHGAKLGLLKRGDKWKKISIVKKLINYKI